MGNSSISERIGELVLHFTGGNKSKFAAIVGTSEANIRNYIEGRQPKFDFLSSVAQNFEINYDWLLTGRGEMLCKENAQVNAQALKKNTSEDDKILCKENAYPDAYPDAYLTEKGVNLSSEENGQVLEKNITESITQSITEVEMLRKDADLTEKSNEQTPLRIEPSKMSSFAVPFYDIPVSAGPLGVLTYSREAMQPDGYIDMEIFRRCEAILPVVGVSMEPEIHSGDLIGIRKLEHYSWEYIETGKVYMIITQEDRMIKYINKADDSDYIICSSPNYHDFKIRKADVLEIYRVIANIRVL